MTERRKAAEEMKARARENMREIYRNSGHGFSAADIEKLCDDSSQEINQWAAFAAKERDSALLEAAGLVEEDCNAVEKLLVAVEVMKSYINNDKHIPWNNVLHEAAAIRNLAEKEKQL